MGKATNSQFELLFNFAQPTFPIIVGIDLENTLHYEKERRMAQLGWIYPGNFRNWGSGPEFCRVKIFFSGLVGRRRPPIGFSRQSGDGGVRFSFGLYRQK